MKAVNSNQDMLYRFALDCAEHKQNNDCKREYTNQKMNIPTTGLGHLKSDGWDT
jgi:hypothetical protein